MPRTEILLVDEEMEGERLDAFVTEQLDELSRSLVKTLIENGEIRVDSKQQKPSYRLKAGEEIIVEIPAVRELKLKAQDIPLSFIYQDKDIAVIDKPKGMVAHPAHGNWENTLVNALLFHLKDLSGINGELRPGIVHRLDKDTSGVMVIAKNDMAHRQLAAQIKDHSINREYITLVHGIIKENLGSIEAPIGRSKQDRKKMAVIAGGRPAVSNYQVLERLGNYTLLKVKLLTGRTHQIRVHFAYIKHPVVGDPLYGSGKKQLGLDTQALHAHLLGFKHPSSGEYREFKSELPLYFECILSDLRNKR
ncbi:RluA family pseudouridine synthase [Syntrophomonas wolfei]|uniref:Pseudouridine synthase n=1 Tax=Syntrophomonas wolfei subsp. wolfei (strain DSM 2245B / Goettingen) TaxID=335541 RepID=Q0AXF9_SYNWW|nr:RluA family pseudouridine synthase [Syntrophomonas wolfei]ABI68595.1 ribosomal large subunit pseudouridine synthase D [Syntrophomonas wolfei subsp. wolfei str. Goettingen G311]